MKLARTGNKTSHGRKCYASGGRVEEDISDPGSLPSMGSGPMDDDMGGIDGGKAKPRLDRAGKKGASNTINIVVTGSKPDTPATPLPNAGPPMPPPPAMGPPPGAPPMPMRAAGGRVNRASGGAVSVSEPDDKFKGLSDKQVLDRARTYASNFDRIKAGKTISNESQGGTKYQERKNGGRVNRADGGKVKGKTGTQSGDVEESKTMKAERLGQKVSGYGVAGLSGIGGPKTMALGIPAGTALAANSEEPNIRDVWADKARQKLQGRKTGGRVNLDAGAGGGLGRLEKAKAYGDKPAKGK